MDHAALRPVGFEGGTHRPLERDLPSAGRCSAGSGDIRATSAQPGTQKPIPRQGHGVQLRVFCLDHTRRIADLRLVRCAAPVAPRRVPGRPLSYRARPQRGRLAEVSLQGRGGPQTWAISSPISRAPSPHGFEGRAERAVQRPDWIVPARLMSADFVLDIPSFDRPLSPPAIPLGDGAVDLPALRSFARRSVPKAADRICTPAFDRDPGRLKSGQ
jgi:hypothetical protein